MKMNIKNQKLILNPLMNIILLYWMKQMFILMTLNITLIFPQKMELFQLMK